MKKRNHVPGGSMMKTILKHRIRRRSKKHGSRKMQPPRFIRQYSIYPSGLRTGNPSRFRAACPLFLSVIPAFPFYPRPVPGAGKHEASFRGEQTESFSRQFRSKDQRLISRHRVKVPDVQPCGRDHIASCPIPADRPQGNIHHRCDHAAVDHAVGIDHPRFRLQHQCQTFLFVITVQKRQAEHLIERTAFPRCQA